MEKERYHLLRLVPFPPKSTLYLPIEHLYGKNEQHDKGKFHPK